MIDEVYRARASQLTQQARAALEAGRLADAESLARRAAHLDPSAAESRSILAAALERRGDAAGAARELAAATRLDPSDTTFAARLVDVWARPIAFLAIIGTVVHFVVRALMRRFDEQSVVIGLVVLTAAVVTLVLVALLRRRRTFAGLSAEDRALMTSIDRRAGWNRDERVALVVAGVVIVFLSAATVLFGAGTKRSTDMAVGDCFTISQTSSIQKVSTIPCELPHSIEIYAQFLDPAAIGAPYPGLAAVHEAAFARCRAPFTALTGQTYDAQRRFTIHDYVPEQDYWDQGVRDTWCGIAASDGTQLVGRIRSQP